MALSGSKGSGMIRFLASLSATLAACALAASAQPVTVFRTKVELVRVLATVKTASGDLTSLPARTDFQVFDNEVPQEIAIFERSTEMPLSVALLVDVSASTNKELKYEAESGARFARALLKEGNEEDHLALYSFNDEVSELVRWSRSEASIERGLKTLHGTAGTALYDAILLASHQLEERDGRRVIIVVTDGGDTSSSTTLQKALRAAQSADAVLYAIVVLPITNDAGRNIGGENALTFLAESTGGRTFLPSVGAALDQAFTDIISELRTQYLIGYYPRGVPSVKGTFHRIRLQLSTPGLRVSARSGYYGEAVDGPDPAPAGDSISPGREKTKK
jgi:Ca-activated chloride channel homolog